MPRRWCLGVTVVIWISICAPVASAQQPPLPGTPTVTVPPVTVPPVTVPPVTVPPVTVAPTPVTPEVTTPPVQTPTVTTPSVSTSSGAASGAGGGSGSGGGQSSSAAGSGSGQSGSGQAGGAGQSGTGQSGTGQPSGTGASGAGQSETGASGAAKSGSRSGDDAGNAPARLRDRDRNLRRTVLGHEACLGQMPRGERRVLTLRAGVALAHPRSRAQVQRITGLRRTRVAALERSGLKRLRSLAKAGGCGQAASAAPGDVAPPTGVSGTRGIPDGASIPRIAVLGARESNGAGTAPAPPTGSPDAQRPLLHAPDGAVDLAPAILFVLLAGLVFAAVRDARRSA